MLCLFILYKSEQAGDIAVHVHVNIHGGGVLGQAGHRHDAAADNDHKARTGAQTHLAHIQRVTLGRTRQLGVVAEGILRFGNADRQLAITQRGQLVQRFFVLSMYFFAPVRFLAFRISHHV